MSRDRHDLISVRLDNARRATENRSMLRALSLGSMLAVMSLVAERGAAQSDAELSEARTLFEEGVTALDEARFAEAAELLSRSIAIRESPPALYNLALALRGAGRYRDALRHAERYLELAVGARYAEPRAEIEALRQELRAGIAHLTLEVTGSPDRVELDGELVGEESVRLALERDPGPVRVSVRRRGYALVEESFELARGESRTLTLRADATPLPARVRIDVDAADAEVSLDGETVPAGADLEASPGAHRVAVRARGYVPQERAVELEPGGELRLTIVLEPLAPTPVYEEWWFWTSIVGGVVALAAVGVGIGFAGAPAQQPIELGTLGFSQEVLTLGGPRAAIAF